MKTKLSIIKLKPAFKDYLWGGTILKEKYQKQCDLDIVAESWELSARKDGPSIVVSGPEAGVTFGEYLEKLGKEKWGWKCQTMAQFPILVKFIDAKQPLSIQVHPDDAYAQAVEHEYGKNEMWYIMECAEEAGIYCGFRKDTTREEVEARVKDNTIEEILNWIPVRKGDAFYIQAGTAHAIGAGTLICEIQQSSNSTYRLYDYGRREKAGNLRELHLKKALDVLDYKKYDGLCMDGCEAADRKKCGEPYADGCEVTSEAYRRRKLICCPYFESVLYDVKNEAEIALSEDTFLSVVCIEGNGAIKVGGEVVYFQKGDSMFVPAMDGNLRMCGVCQVIATGIS